LRLTTILRLRCPACERTPIFNGFFDTPHRCPQCGYFFMRENGYFRPHVAIGYGVTVAVALGVWPLMRWVFNVHSDAIILSTMIVVGILFGVWFLRYAKMLWLALDLTIHPPTREDYEPRGRDAQST
jgi:uncharacterized protein (DUF983 family)